MPKNTTSSNPKTYLASNAVTSMPNLQTGVNSSKKSLAHQKVIDDETAISQYEFKMSAFSTECAIN